MPSLVTWLSPLQVGRRSVPSLVTWLSPLLQVGRLQHTIPGYLVITPSWLPSYHQSMVTWLSPLLQVGRLQQSIALLPKNALQSYSPGATLPAITHPTPTPNALQSYSPGATPSSASAWLGVGLGYAAELLARRHPPPTPNPNHPNLNPKSNPNPHPHLSPSPSPSPSP